MATDRQISANQRNAKRSSGPKTAEGKAAVRRNALKHGLLAGEVLLPNEDAAALAELSERVREDLDPQGALESLLVDRIIQGLWRLRRLGRVEAGVFAFARWEIMLKRAEGEARRSTSNLMADLERVQSSETITDAAAHAAAVEKVEEAKRGSEEELPTWGKAFRSEEHTLANLSRYESGIERGIYKALHELQRRQAARLGQPVAPPIAADVDGTLSMADEGSVELAKQSQSRKG